VGDVVASNGNIQTGARPLREQQRIAVVFVFDCDAGAAFVLVAAERGNHRDTRDLSRRNEWRKIRFSHRCCERHHHAALLDEQARRRLRRGSLRIAAFSAARRA
jgi:crotonobetainyl-CoA:carnitine CoA-transferase CaiB-like acyl-CoA transferase